MYFAKFPRKGKKEKNSAKNLSKKSLKVNCNKKTVRTVGTRPKNRDTLDIRKGQFFNNLLLLLHPPFTWKAQRRKGRGTRFDIESSASIWTFDFSMEGLGWNKRVLFATSCFPCRSITTVLYLSGGGHRDRLSTSNQRRVEDKRAKKSWSKNRRGSDGGGLLLFFQFATSKGGRSPSSFFVLRLFVPSQINSPIFVLIFASFARRSFRGIDSIGRLVTRGRWSLVCFSFLLSLIFFFTFDFLWNVE